MDDVEVKKTVDSGTSLEIELENCRKKCLDLEERSKQAEERCLVLENEVTKLKSEFMVLNGRFEALGTEKLAVEDELRVLKKRNEDLQERVVSQSGTADKLIDLNDGGEEEDRVLQLMIENKVLECEKKKAESEVVTWKGMYKYLEGLLFGSGERSLSAKLEGLTELPKMGRKEMMNEAMDVKDGLNVVASAMHFQTENKLVGGEEKIDADTGVSSTLYSADRGNGNLQSSGTPTTACSTFVEGEHRGILSDSKLEYGSRVRKQLAFGEARSPNKKMAPCTPAGARPASIVVIDIVDSDCESEGSLPKKEFSSRKNLKNTILEQSDEEDIDGYKGSSPFVATPKRKRASNIVTSDSECDVDDNLPICKFISQPPVESNTDSHLSSSPEEAVKAVTRRRLLRLTKCELKYEPERSSPSPSKSLMRLRKCELKDELERSSPSRSKLQTSKNEYMANEDVEDTKEDGSESEGESLGGFIVKSSDDSDSGCESKNGDDSVSADAADEFEDASDGNMDIGEIMSRIRRKRNQNSKWEFEADMLASFGKDPEMCMKAVCALYRQQTADEKDCKGTIHFNQRGFSQCDASRGTRLAEFLTDGDQKGDLVKSVEELQAFDRKGVEVCRKLATHYSKQLFEIYLNKEDPFFLPS